MPLRIEGMKLGGPKNLDRRRIKKLINIFKLEKWDIRLYRLPINLVDDDAFVDYCERRKKAFVFMSRNADIDVLYHEFTHPVLGRKKLDQKLSDEMQEGVCEIIREVLKGALKK